MEFTVPDFLNLELFCLVTRKLNVLNDPTMSRVTQIISDYCRTKYIVVHTTPLKYGMQWGSLI